MIDMIWYDHGVLNWKIVYYIYSPHYYLFILSMSDDLPPPSPRVLDTTQDKATVQKRMFHHN